MTTEDKKSEAAIMLPCRKCGQDLAAVPICNGGTMGATPHRHCQNPKCLVMNPEKK